MTINHDVGRYLDDIVNDTLYRVTSTLDLGFDTSKTARGSTSRINGRSAADHEIAFRGREFEKKPSPRSESSRDGRSVCGKN